MATTLPKVDSAHGEALEALDLVESLKGLGRVPGENIVIRGKAV
jgi:hypothetical protein